MVLSINLFSSLLVLLQSYAVKVNYTVWDEATQKSFTQVLFWISCGLAFIAYFSLFLAYLHHIFIQKPDYDTRPNNVKVEGGDSVDETKKWIFPEEKPIIKMIQQGIVTKLNWITNEEKTKKL